MFTGYVSRCGSDSDESSDLDMEPLVNLVSDKKPRLRIRSSSDPDGRNRKDSRRNKDESEKGEKPGEDKRLKDEKGSDTKREKFQLDKNDENESSEHRKEVKRVQDCGQIEIHVTDNDSGRHARQEGEMGCDEDVRAAEEEPSVSDSCHTDSHVLTSASSDTLDGLEEDDLMSCSSSSIHPSAASQSHTSVHSSFHLHPYSHGHVQPHLLAPPPAHSHPLIHLTTPDRGGGGGACRRSGDGADPQLTSPVSTSSQSLADAQRSSGNLCTDDSSLCFAELSRLVDFLPSPPEASEEDDDEEELRRRRNALKETDGGREGGSVSKEGGFKEYSSSPSPSSNTDFVFNFDQSDARCYYNICSNITPDSARSLSHKQREEREEGEETQDEDLEPIPILHPPPGFGDSSSDEEFFDARDRFTSPEDPTSGAVPRGDLLFTVRLISRIFKSCILISNKGCKFCFVAI